MMAKRAGWSGSEAASGSLRAPAKRTRRTAPTRTTGGSPDSRPASQSPSSRVLGIREKFHAAVDRFSAEAPLLLMGHQALPFCVFPPRVKSTPWSLSHGDIGYRIQLSSRLTPAIGQVGSTSQRVPLKTSTLLSFWPSMHPQAPTETMAAATSARAAARCECKTGTALLPVWALDRKHR